MLIKPKLQPTELSVAFKLSLPTLFAYFPLGMVFGILFAHSGFNRFLGPLMSAVLYSGSVQFVALSMMTKHAGIIPIVAATVFIAIRNSFYGLNLLPRFNQRGLLRAFLIFTLVDATYAILMTHPPDKNLNDSKFCFLLSFLIFGYWVGGTVVGAIFATWLPPVHGLAFILPSFFMVLVVEFFIAKRQWHAIIAPILSAIIAYIILPNQYLLLAIIFSMITIFAINYFKRAM